VNKMVVGGGAGEWVFWWVLLGYVNNLGSFFFFFYSVLKCANLCQCVTLNLKTSSNYFDENASTSSAISYMQ